MKKIKLLNLALASTITLSGIMGFASSSSASSFGQDVASTAKEYIGYKITDFNSADFISYVLEQEGLDVPNNLLDLSQEGKLILSKSSLQIGDVVFFGKSRSNLIAAGIYTGQGKFVIAYKSYNQIKEISLDSEVAKRYFLGAKRISAQPSPTPAPTPSQPQQENPVTPAPSNGQKPAWEVTADKVLARGMKNLGVDYKIGADYTRDGSMKFDCSSFTEQMFEEAAGFNLSRSSRAQFLNDGSKQLTRNELRKGDLIFTTTSHNYKKYDEGDYRRNGHVGIVKEVHADGTIEMLHTYKPGIGVVVTTLQADGKDFWSQAFLYGKRIIADDGSEAVDVIMKKDGLVEGK